MGEGKTSYGITIFLCVIVFLSCMAAGRDSEKEAREEGYEKGYEEGYDSAYLEYGDEYGEAEYVIALSGSDVDEILRMLDSDYFEYRTRDRYGMDLEEANAVLYLSAYEDLASEGYTQSDLTVAYDTIESYLEDVRDRDEEVVSIIEDTEYGYYAPQY